MRTYYTLVALLFFCGLNAEALPQQNDNRLPGVDEFSEDKQRFEGFVPFVFEESSGEIWLEISDWQREFLFVHSLGTGLGSNPVGLDRGQLGSEYVCRFDRVGKKVLLVAQNLSYRASSNNVAEQRAVRESFAESILWGGTIEARTGDRVLVKATSLLMSDLHGVVSTLRGADQGDYSVDESRSAVYLHRCKAFPQNTELEATVTLRGSKPGGHVRQVAPVANAITLRHHFSFVALPDDAYVPRLHDPRTPSIFIRFSDYSAPIDRALEQRWITRHRLVKKNPDAAVSDPVEPIVYYVDAGAPPQIRDALVEGASWWNEAFEAAGFKNAFQVKIMPPDADPLDVRYNVIQWVHRSTRGWSYGSSVVDPRTGEIIKGHVTLGSLRVRQDRLLFDALAPASLQTANVSQRCACCGAVGVPEDSTLASLAGPADSASQRAVETALSRIRQLSAHEVGHTLGFAHNFAASTYDDRASVMDYPAPRVKITQDNQLDLSDAYGVGIGSWDKFAVQYSYSQFDPDADEAAELEKLVNKSIEDKMLFVSDADARPAGASHPLGNLWDNGANPVSQLQHVMRVRKLALEKLSTSSLLDGQPVADMEQLFVPVYLYHRYQLNAVAKLIGGVEYSYAVKGDAQVPVRDVAEFDQRKAFDAMLETIKPTNLVIPPHLLAVMPPQPYRSLRDVERFPSTTSPTFDSHSAVRVAVDMTVGNLLQPQRISRLAAQTDQAGLRVDRLIRDLIDFSMSSSEGHVQIEHIVRQAILDHLIRLADDPNASLAVRAHATNGIRSFKSQIARHSGSRAYRHAMLRQIERFENRPYPSSPPYESLEPPPGSPIGSLN